MNSRCAYFGSAMAAAKLLICSCVLLALQAYVALAQDQKAAMVDLQKAIDPSNKLGWDTSKNPCDGWSGITCKDGKVTTM